MGLVKICLSAYGSTASLCELLNDSTADLFEIRVDLSEPLDLVQLRRSTQKPLIFTSHNAPDLLMNAAPYADYLDVGPELKSGPQYIVSIHADEGDPYDLWQKYSGDHITKIVLNTGDYTAISKLMELNRTHAPNAICFAMGDIGSFSRVVSLFHGAKWIYASLPGMPTAPGQFTIDELYNVYRISRFEAAPEVFGILGNPVTHSRSPEYHNKWFAEAQMQWIYLPFPCVDLVSFMKSCGKFGVRGLSVTHPYKEAVIQFLASFSDEVKLLRSCNTMLRIEDQWYGINTDVQGIAALLESEKIQLQGSYVAIIGAGGAASAAAYVAQKAGAKISIFNRTLAKAEQLAAAFGGRAYPLSDFGNEKCDVLIQATSCGMKAGECPVNPDVLHQGTLVIDAIYEPDETMLLQKAKSLGCHTINGKAWFEAQAEAQFSWWKGKAGAHHRF